MWKQEKFNLTYYPLQILYYGGLHPRYNNLFLKFHFFGSLLMAMLVVTLCIVQVLVSYKKDLHSAIESSAYMFLSIQSVVQMTILNYTKHIQCHLLNQRKRFWKIENFDDKIREECEELLKMTSKFIRRYSIFIIGVFAAYLLQPLITKELPVNMYVPGNGWFNFLLVCCYYLSFPFLASIHGVALFICALCIPLTVQFKLLIYEFERMTTDDIHHKNKFKKYVDHHNFLISYSKEVNKFANGIFLCHFLTTISVSCIQLFVVSQQYFNYWIKVKSTGNLLAEIVVTAIYCFSSEMISEATKNVGNAIYNSVWHESNIYKARQNLLLIIKRAQKNIVFNAFGLVEINMETFTKIYKAVLSFNSYINTLALSQEEDE